MRAVVGGEYGRVNRVGSGDGLRLGDERAFGAIAHRHADLEYAVGAFCGEVQISLAVALCRIRCPHLPLRPGHIAHMQHLPEVFHRRTWMRHAQHVVVGHVEMRAVVAEGHAGIEVVRGIDIQRTVEYMCGRVGGVEVGDQRCGNGGARQRLQISGLQFIGHARTCA